MTEYVVLVPAVAAATALQVIAQAPVSEVNPNVIVGLLGNAGIVGALIWYMYYHTTKSTPKMLDTFAEQLEAQRKSSEEKHDKLRETFEREMARLRDHSERERTHHAHQMEELRKMLMESMRSMRVAVHDVKDAAHQAITKSAEMEMQARKVQSDSKHGG